MKSYLLKIKTKYLKKPELLSEYGFLPYDVGEYSDEGEFIASDDKCYAIPLILNHKSQLFEKVFKPTLEYTYKVASETDKADLSESFSFTDNGKVYPTDEFYAAFDKVQLTVKSFGEDRGLFFINTPTDEFYSYEIISNEFPEIIEKLITDGVAYLKRCPKNKK